jgi:hypothetical protein
MFGCLDLVIFVVLCCADFMRFSSIGHSKYRNSKTRKLGEVLLFGLGDIMFETMMCCYGAARILRGFEFSRSTDKQ